MADVTAQALEEKKKGNTAYQNKDFPKALLHYGKAIELNPKEITFRANRAAVYLEQDKCDECIKECQEAVATGRENKADVKMIAKAFLRMGNAYAKKGDWKNASTSFRNSLRENHTADAETKLNEAEKKVKDEVERQLKKQEEEQKKEQERLKENQRKARQEQQEAEEKKRQEEEQYKKENEASLKEKDKGNDCYRKGDYDGALKHYNEAIKLNPKDAKIYSNRAATYIKKQKFFKALEDCNKSIQFDPKLAKSYARKGSIMFANGEHTMAAEAYQQALKIEPNNAEHVINFRKCREQVDPQELRELALQDPEIVEILGDPEMRKILKSMQEDPKAAQEHFKDQDIVNQVQKLFHSGLLCFH